MACMHACKLQVMIEWPNTSARLLMRSYADTCALSSNTLMFKPVNAPATSYSVIFVRGQRQLALMDPSVQAGNVTCDVGPYHAEPLSDQGHRPIVNTALDGSHSA